MPSPWPQSPPTAAHRAAYADAVARSYWLDTLPERTDHPPLGEVLDADLCIVGGGYTGLWAALYAKELEPAREVVLLEASRCGDGASGRNGGFLQSSLTHGTRNGLTQYPHEIVELERLGFENFHDLIADLQALGIDAELERAGDLVVALEPRELAVLDDEADLLSRFGYQVERLDGEQVRAQITSKKFIGALWTRSGSALVNPGRLADGLRAAAVRAGVRIHERTPVRRLHHTGPGVSAITDHGVVNAGGALIATSAYPPLVRTIRRYVAPVYDYALVSEPVDPAAVGWRAGQGLSDMGNQFHYARVTADGRILWGGYDAVYRYGGPVGAELDDHEPTFARLSQHFFTVFPQLHGVRFTHRWGGASDTCSRVSGFFGRTHGGRAAYALGYTGLGVGATRFGARVMLDLLSGQRTELTELEMVRSKPLPFPPEPFAYLGVQATRWSLDRADRRSGRRNLLLRGLDAIGMGYDS